MRAHLWTGWAGELTSTGGYPGGGSLSARCQSLYERGMEVLQGFNRMLQQQWEERTRGGKA